MTWWWVGYTDNKRPKGERARGCVVVQASHLGEALAVAADYAGDMPPRIEANVGEIEEKYGDPPPGYTNRLLQLAEATELADKWQLGGLADATDIAEAFSDDDAVDGEPLFKRSP